MRSPFSLILLAMFVLGSVFFLIADLSPDEAIEKPAINARDNLIETDSNQSAGEEIHYLVDIEKHGPDEIETLLRRAEALSEETGEVDKNIKIAIVIHGPDMDIFDKKNYEKHKDIVDLAARLETNGVIDFKICQTVAKIRGISDGAFPSFMEMVPFAPAELDQLKQRGYVEL